MDTTWVFCPFGDFFEILTSCVGGPCLVESFYVLGSNFGNFEVCLTKGSSYRTLCSSFLILVLSLMLPSPLPRCGALLGTLCKGVYLAMCLCSGFGWPFVCLKRNACFSHDVVHDACGTRVVWKTIRVEWLLLERTPPAIHCFVQGKVGYFAHNSIANILGYQCTVLPKLSVHCVDIRGVGL